MSRFILAFATLMLIIGVSPSWAVPIGVLEIQFTGLNLTYDGSTISDAGSTAGGTGDPADADPLDSVEFKVNGISQGMLTSDISVDVSLPDVTGLSDVIPATVVVTSGATSGYFDLLIGTTPSATEFLRLDTSSVTVTYANVTSTIQFVFGGALVAIDGQNLPFDLVAGNPVTVSFSTKLDAGSKTASSGIVTGFTSSGTGEINGQAVPEPATCVLVALSVAATLLTRPRM
jgi:hypothetical protein